MHYRKLSIISKLAHPPLQVILIVSLEDFLGEKLAVRKLKDLSVEILLLFWDKKRNLWDQNALAKDVLGILWEL